MNLRIGESEDNQEKERLLDVLFGEIRLTIRPDRHSQLVRVVAALLKEVKKERDEEANAHAVGLCLSATRCGKLGGFRKGQISNGPGGT
jgi:hypothetical protein